MKLIALNDRPVDQYLKAYDPEAHDGRGTVDGCLNLDDAMKFPTAEAAMRLWRTVSTTRPKRADGQPNRPLSAFTVEIKRVAR